MVYFSWKYLSVGLLAILAIGFSVPQAFAHITNNTQHMLQHIYNIVNDIVAKTNNLPADPASNTVVNTRASQSSLDDLQTDVTEINEKTGFKVVEFSLERNPADDSIQFVQLLPFVEGQVYAGHMELSIIENPGNTVTGLCGLKDGIAGHHLFIQADENNTILLPRDFTCSFLALSIRDSPGDGDAMSAFVNGIVSYSQTAEVSQLE